jgi:hypothetical protein
MKLGFFGWIAKTVTQKMASAGVKSWNFVKSVFTGANIPVPFTDLAKFWNAAEQEKYLQTMQGALEPDIPAPLSMMIPEDWRMDIPYKAVYKVTRYNPLTGKNEEGFASRYFMEKPTEEESINDLMEYEGKGYPNQRGVLIEASMWAWHRNTRLT